MGIGEPTLLDPSILASTLDDLNGLYTIGTYAARLNVASQQRRAINLIDSIDRELKIAGKGSLERKRMLIVGAGAAGVAAAIAAKLYDASISLVDKAGAPFSLLKDAEHRILSPKQNNWPFEDIGHTTYLPFCNWYEADGKTVEDCLKEDWDNYAMNMGVEFEPSVEVTELNEDAGSGKWSVTFKEEPKNARLQDTFDIVIFATGYGQERDCGDGKFPSYWNRDHHRNHLSILTGLRHNKAVVVKGNGDGGLIEAISQAYAEIEPGGYPVEFLAELSKSQVTEQFRAVEHDVRSRLTAYQLKQIGKPNRSLKKANEEYQKFLDVIDQDLWHGYKRIIEPMLEKEDNFLHKLEFNNKNKFGNVYVVGRNHYPFSINSSPINRILYVTALLTKTATYLRDPDGSAVDVTGNTLQISDAEVFDPKTNLMKTHLLTKKVNCAVELRRFGSVSPLVNIKVNGEALKNRETEIRTRQRLYADHDSIDPQLALNLWQKLQGHRINFEEHPNYLAERANAFCQEFFKSETERPMITCTVSEAEKARCEVLNQSFRYSYQLQYNATLKNSGGSYRTSLMKFPEKLFGVPVHQTSDALENLVR